MTFFLIGLIVGVVLGAAAAVFHFRNVLRRVRGAERRLRDSERLAYLGSLAGGLAHEIKNPLSTLHLNLELLEEDLASAESASKHTSRLSVPVSYTHLTLPTN